jgi:signal transduction histidine kinase
MADPARITQVLANILNNAIKFSDTGSIKISTKKDSSRKEVCVQIEDSGRGISKEIMPKLFTKFATTSSTDATKGGTGLGLHLSSKIIEAHGGRIQAYNKTGSGATFEIILPNMTREGKKIENPVLIHS